MKKRILSSLMALVMIIGLVPMTAFAQEDKNTPSVEEEDDAEEDEGEEEDVKLCYWVNKVALDGEKITPQSGYWTELGLNEGEVLTVRFCYGTKTENETVVPADAPVFKPDKDADEDAVTITADKDVEGVYEITAVSVGSGTIEVLLEGNETIEFSVVVEEAEDEDDGDHKDDNEADDEDKENDEDDEDEIIRSPEILGDNTAFFEYDGAEYVIGFTDEKASYYVDGTKGNYTQDDIDAFQEGHRYQHEIYIGISEIGESQGLEDLKEASDMYKWIEDIEIYTAVYDVDERELVPIRKADSLYSPSYEFSEPEKDETGQYYVPFYHQFKEGYHYLVGEVKLEGVEEVLQFCFYFESTYVPEKEIDLRVEGWTIDEINKQIASKKWQDSKVERYTIILDPEVTYSGTLELQGEKKIVIEGNGATLEGNVVVTRPKEENDTEIMRYHEIHGLHMVSKAEDMVGISGDGNIFAMTVNFEGYARAVEAYDAEDTELQKTAFSHCWFIDNGVGIYWDGQDELKRSGNSKYDINDCRFEENDIAIQVVNHKKIDDTAHLIQIENCEFVDNEKDIVNTSKYTYWAEGCYFAGENTDKEMVSRPAKTEKIIVSYIYKEPILEYQELPEDKGITNKNRFIKGFKGGTPVAPDGDFAYNNESGEPSIEMADFDKNITVLGKYDLEKDKHKLIGTWHFGEGDAE